jgi:cbb3-type cytochrome oxidase maturation protein
VQPPRRRPRWEERLEMNALYITIPISLLLVLFFVAAFIIAVRRDQFDDLVTPAHRILLDDDEPNSHGKDDADVSI